MAAAALRDTLIHTRYPVTLGVGVWGFTVSFASRSSRMIRKITEIIPFRAKRRRKLTREEEKKKKKKKTKPRREEVREAHIL